MSNKSDQKNQEGKQPEEGTGFLKKKFYTLHSSPEAVSAANRIRSRVGEVVSQKPTDRIENYLQRFRDILDRKDEGGRERGIEALKRILHSQQVIKPENIPESYFDNQRRLIRELGHGDVEITDEMRKQLVDTIIADQTSTLDLWINYLTHKDADVYPDWAKYWVFRSMLGLSTYDKEKKKFGKRGKDTVAPFPDLNREALAYVVDIVVKKAKKEEVEVAEDNVELKKLTQGENFGELYAYAIESVTPTEENELEKTAGEWITYKQGSDHMPLVKSLQGHGTGWCTAGESTAETQLKGGDFYVYYSYDQDGKPTIPRLAIRMEGDSIAEVRGVAPEQNLDPYIAPVLEEKLKEFGSEGEAYQKKSSDMERLTFIDKKQKRNEELTTEEIRFLYELDGPIEGFGYECDPRIQEIKDARNIEEDAEVIDVITILEKRFINPPEHYVRPEGIDFIKVKAALEANPVAIRSLALMELTGGAPDIVAETKDSFILGDCSMQSPLGRRNMDWYHSYAMAERFGCQLMDGDTYKDIQKNGRFDTNSWSWLDDNPEEVKESGRALYGYRFHGGADVFQYSADGLNSSGGWRGLLRVHKT